MNVRDSAPVEGRSGAAIAGRPSRMREFAAAMAVVPPFSTRESRSAELRHRLLRVASRVTSISARSNAVYCLRCTGAAFDWSGCRRDWGYERAECSADPGNQHTVGDIHDRDERHDEDEEWHREVRGRAPPRASTGRRILHRGATAAGSTGRDGPRIPEQVEPRGCKSDRPRHRSRAARRQPVERMWTGIQGNQS